MLSIYKIIYNKALGAKINDWFLSLSLTVVRGIRLGKNLQIKYKRVYIQHIYMRQLCSKELEDVY